MRGPGAALALLLLAAAALAAPEGIEALVGKLSDPAGRYAAMNELRRRKDPAAIAPLVQAIRETDDGLTRYYAIMVLDGYPADLVRGAFRTLLREEDPYVSLAAATALWREGDRSVLPVIVKALGAEAPAADRVRMLSRLYSIHEPEVRDAIRDLLRPGGDPTLLGLALHQMNQFRPEDSLGAAEGLLADPRPGVKAMAAAFLYVNGAEDRAADLVAALGTGEVGPSEFYRVQSLLMGAGAVADSILDAVLDVAARGDPPLVAQRAVEFLARFRHRKAVPLFRALLESENDGVAKAAFEALAAMTGGFSPESLKPLLESKRPIRRLWAADALRRMDDLSGLEVATALLAKGALAERIEAARVLGGFRVDAAVDPLIDALADENSAVRAGAYSSLSQVLPALFPARRLSLNTTGYVAGSPPAANAAAIATIREWWEAHRSSDW